MDLETELFRFRPLVTATARRYAGRGAEFEDLVQEGYVALLELIPRCPEREKLPLFLKRRLPGRVRSAAKREWRCDERREYSPLEELEGTPNEPAVQPPEIGGEGIAGLLSVAELQMVSLLAEGWSQNEVAAKLCVTQQSVSARLHRIRERVDPPER
jgi:RNA polymerase sigma factor (sigma-70 family)